MTERKQYIKPLALNLSGFGVVGQEPFGICIDGSYPASACDLGTSPDTGSECAPAGAVPDQGFCQAGSVVAAGCSAGSIPNPN